MQAGLILITQDHLVAEESVVSRAKQEAVAACQGKTPEELIPLLGDVRFVIRQSAQDQLLYLMRKAPADVPHAVEQACYTHFLTNPEPEIRARSMEILREHATHHWSPVGYLGVASEQDSSFDESGNMVSQVKITKVAANSPAAKAGILPDDMVSSVDDLRFTDAKAKERFAAYLTRKGPGDAVILHIIRNSKKLDITVVLAAKERPKEFDEEHNEIAPDPEKCLREYLEFRKSRPL